MTQNNKRISTVLIKNLLNAWKGLSSPFSGKRLVLSAYLHEDEIAPLRDKISECLASKGGRVSARARAAELGKAYLGLNDEGKTKYLTLLAEEFGVDHNLIRVTAEKLFADLDDHDRGVNEQLLRSQLTPPFLTLLTQFNALPDGLRFLVNMRADLIRLNTGSPALQSMESELKNQLRSWFDIGFLNLKRIDWNAPASLLEKLIHYETVHEVESWNDLQHRLADNRRCFAFFHPRMPDEPLIFVWVALVNELSDNVRKLLDVTASELIEEEDDTAIFYSIGSTQSGLTGVSLGDYLIKRVTDELRAELPQLTRFSTLSPIPGFTDWLVQQAETNPENLYTTADRATVALCTDQSIETLLKEHHWYDDEPIASAMENILLPLAARYLVTEKRADNHALNAVANFHLTNGANIERINWKGDNTVRGQRQSNTLMVNYLYDLELIEQHHEQYIEHGIIATSKNVASLLETVKTE